MTLSDLIFLKEGQSLRNCVKEIETNSVSIEELEVGLEYCSFVFINLEIPLLA